MKVKTIYKGLCAATLGAALTFGASFQANALPAFDVSPLGVGAAQPNFTADHITGNSSTLVTFNPATSTIDGAGWLIFSAFTLNGIPVSSNVGAYQLFANFTYSGSLDAGPGYGMPGSNFTLTNLHYDLYANSANSSTFVQGDATTATAATSVLNGATLLGMGDLLVGTAGLNALGGSTLTTTNSFVTTAAGNAYFVAPVPFYPIAFNSITNNSSGIVINGVLTSINATSTSTDFMGNAVPEPGSLALIGAGLIGLFAASRRRKSV